MKHKMGWIRQDPDPRDYSVDHPEIKLILGQIKGPKPVALPKSTDLRKWCTPIVDQGQLGSCTANALAGLVGYFINKYNGKTFASSRLFTYYMTRKLEGSPVNQDTGATIRGTIGSLAQFGVPPESDWPYDIKKYATFPDLYSSLRAQNNKGTKYALIDQPKMTRTAVLTAIKTQLAAGMPIEFGTAVFQGIETVGKDGKIPYPAPGEQPVGGHAIDAVGYDNNLAIGSSKGAFLIRNSWGTSWGMDGYGWMPYDYLLKLPDDQYASDWWILLNENWIDPSKFEFP
jgi:C1A family cysteine protease